VAATRKTIRYL